eukprot:GEZU01015164.1.p1 GENE.GEZU01015164.1~~GEZU01015164.1.p1  ORF type:complete len:226 (-),score=48.41 GEZU01015164.1:18-695(-)
MYDRPEIVGFVPFDYLQEIVDPKTNETQPVPSPQTPATSTSPNSFAKTDSALKNTNATNNISTASKTVLPGFSSSVTNSPRHNPLLQIKSSSSTSMLKQSLSSNMVGASSGAVTPTTASVAAASFSAANGLGTTPTYTESFMRHEQFFKQVMKQREETFKKLEKSIMTTQKEIAQCQEKNAHLADRIKELDKMVEDERRKWRERIEAEKKRIASNSSSNSTASAY